MAAAGPLPRMSAPAAPAPRARGPHASLDQLVEVETPEQIVFSYTVAGVGSRAAAAIIALAIVAVALTALYGLVALAIPGPGIGRSGRAIAVLVAAQFALFWGYYVAFEGLWDGQTPGKRHVGIRVV